MQPTTTSLFLDADKEKGPPTMPTPMTAHVAGQVAAALGLGIGDGRLFDPSDVDVHRAVGQIDVEYLVDVAQEQLGRFVVGAAGDIEARTVAPGLHTERVRDAHVAAPGGAVVTACRSRGCSWCHCCCERRRPLRQRRRRQQQHCNSSNRNAAENIMAPLLSVHNSQGTVSCLLLLMSPDRPTGGD